MKYDVVAMGYPGTVVHDKPLHDPANLGEGWVGFDYASAFGCPVRIVNDALMQALGSYQGGRMLFLGLGTGLGAAMIVENVGQPMEIAHLPYRKGKSYEHYVAEAYRKRRATRNGASACSMSSSVSPRTGARLHRHRWRNVEKLDTLRRNAGAATMHSPSMAGSALEG